MLLEFIVPVVVFFGGGRGSLVLLFSCSTDDVILLGNKTSTREEPSSENTQDPLISTLQYSLLCWYNFLVKYWLFFAPARLFSYVFLCGMNSCLLFVFALLHEPNISLNSDWWFSMLGQDHAQESMLKPGALKAPHNYNPCLIQPGWLGMMGMAIQGTWLRTGSWNAIKEKKSKTGEQTDVLPSQNSPQESLSGWFSATSHSQFMRLRWDWRNSPRFPRP